MWMVVQRMLAGLGRTSGTRSGTARARLGHREDSSCAHAPLACVFAARDRVRFGLVMVKHDTDLADAAAGFDQELAAYTRLGELFVDAPVASVKQLERANATLAEIAACEDRLQAAGQRLIQALAGARARQEQLARDVVARVPVVQARTAGGRGRARSLGLADRALGARR
jgi:hypothetical protein